VSQKVSTLYKLAGSHNPARRPRRDPRELQVGECGAKQIENVLHFVLACALQGRNALNDMQRDERNLTRVELVIRKQQVDECRVRQPLGWVSACGCHILAEQGWAFVSLNAQHPPLPKLFVGKS